MLMISIQEISKSFGPTLAIDNVSFDLAENSFVSIVGPSGCGKSTLLRMVAGLFQPSSGAIIVRDEKVTRPLRDVGVVFLIAGAAAVAQHTRKHPFRCRDGRASRCGPSRTRRRTDGARRSDRF